MRVTGANRASGRGRPGSGRPGKGWALGAVAIAAGAQAGPCLAQSAILPPVAPALSPGGYAPPFTPVPEGVSVADRARPDYQPVGGRLGAFFLYPQLSANWGITDNVRAVDEQRIGDNYWDLQGGAQLVSGFSRHQLKLGGYAGRSFYQGHAGEDGTRYGGSLAARLDFAGQTSIDLTAAAEHLLLARDDYNSPYGAASPVRYDQLQVKLGASRVFNRLTLRALGGVLGLTYHSPLSDTGALIDQRYRSRTGYSVLMRADYELQPGVSLVARAVWDDQAYRLPASDPAQPGGLARSSVGWRAEGGLAFRLTGKLYGEARLGYMRRRYDDARMLTAKGLSFGADLAWNLDARTSLRLTADRRVDETASITSAGARVSEFDLRVEHELARNLILTAEGDYQRQNPLGPDTPSTEWRGEANARWLINRRLSAKVTYRHAQRACTDPAHAFRSNTGLVGVTLAF
ncbi:MAG TPA: outer membrane beta-barrel protein [Novosphingobium sp.]|nr:outer membrane beta-barrel protein [Novosphingobium sp.]